MNNTPHQENSMMMSAAATATAATVPFGDDPNQIVSSERRPKPIRGVGYGDIFAAGAAKPKQMQTSTTASPAGESSIVGSPSTTGERISSTTVNSLQKQIPRKPPPPSPDTNNSANSNGQAPALPPKPAYKFSPHSMHQHMKPLPPIQQHAPHQSLMQMPRREQAKVLYAYTQTVDDELTLNVGDVIDIIDKNCEDVGWWKGELRGKIGVFPDNFVQIITPEVVNNTTTSSTPATISANNVASAAVANASGSIAPTTPSMTPAAISQPSFTPTNNSSSQDWHNNRMSGSNQQVLSTPNSTNITSEVNKLKSVFSMTPKGFSKELEDNLEKRNSPSSFLSLKRNKLQQIAGADQTTGDNAMNETEKKDDIVSSSAENSRDNLPSNVNATGATKLNHITVNRAKGPTRRPPSSVLNKRAPSDNIKTESNGREAVLNDSNMVEQISQNFISEIQELREEVRHLRDELYSFNETKRALELMKVELKACQSATETQARFLRELVSSMVDEKKKLTLMQLDMDQRLR